MAQLYPSLFTFHLLGVSAAGLAKNPKQLPAKNSLNSDCILPTAQMERPIRATGSSLFLRQIQLLDLVKELGLLRPDEQTLNNILAYAAR